MNKHQVPFTVPDIGEEEVTEVVSTLRSGWLTTGPRVAQLENEFKAYVGASNALALNSCTAALHLSLAALGIGPGDEVITTPLTFCATVNCILETGATPVLADIGPDLNIDPQSVARAITHKTRAIVPVHFAGLPCAMNEIWDLATRHNLFVVEDAAHASGAFYRGNPIGNGVSAAVAFSFYATKNLCTGEGGMVVTPSKELHSRMKTLCLHGISLDAWNRYTEKGNWYYEVIERGFKYNMSDLVAAIGIHQLRKLDRMNARRAEIVAAYNRAFQQMPEVQAPPDHPEDRSAWHLYVLRLNLDTIAISRAQFFDEMRRRSIGCSVHFIPIPLHPYYQRVLQMRDPCTRAITEYSRLISLPLYSRMTDHEVQMVVDSVLSVISESRITVPIGASLSNVV